MAQPRLFWTRRHEGHQDSKHSDKETTFTSKSTLLIPKYNTENADTTGQSDAVAQRLFWYAPSEGEPQLVQINSRAAFAGIVTAVSAWSIWGGEMFPAEKDPTGGEDGWWIKRDLA